MVDEVSEDANLGSVIQVSIMGLFWIVGAHKSVAWEKMTNFNFLWMS